MQERGGDGMGWEGVLVCICLPSQGGGVYQLAVSVSPHRCTSAHHKLHMYTT